MPGSETHAAMLQFGQQLETYRTEVRAMSVTDIAKELGISRVTYYRMKKGEPCSMEQWIKVWEKMGVLEEILKASEPDMFQAAVREFPGYG